MYSSSINQQLNSQEENSEMNDLSTDMSLPKNRFSEQPTNNSLLGEQKEKPAPKGKSALSSALNAPSQISRTGLSNNMIGSGHDLMAKHTVYWTNKNEEDKTYKVIIELPQLESLLEAIRDVIPYMNEKIAEDGSNISLSSDPTLYKVYYAKKNGKPKSDYPSIDASLALTQVKLQSFALVEISDEAIIDKTKIVEKTTPQDDSISREYVSRTTMTSTPMLNPNESQRVETPLEVDNQEEATCWCFGKKKAKKQQQPQHDDNTNNDLTTKLL